MELQTQTINFRFHERQRFRVSTESTAVSAAYADGKRGRFQPGDIRQLGAFDRRSLASLLGGVGAVSGDREGAVMVDGARWSFLYSLVFFLWVDVNVPSPSICVVGRHRFSEHMFD